MRRLITVLSVISLLALPALGRAAASPPQDKAARVQAVMHFASAQCARLAKDVASFCLLDDTTEPADVIGGGVPLIMFEG